jgi:hypothetical protein
MPPNERAKNLQRDANAPPSPDRKVDLLDRLLFEVAEVAEVEAEADLLFAMMR